MSVVGYLEGTPSIFLSRVSLDGLSTLPLGNGFDGHGKYVAHIAPQDNICVVVGYLHKILPTPGLELTPADLLFACRTHSIPAVIIAPEGRIEEARKLLGAAAKSKHVTVVDRDELYDTVMQLVKECDE